MGRLTRLVLFITMCVGAVAALLTATADGEILTSPPEIVAESFMKQLQTNRYDRAVPFLAEDLRSNTSPDDLELFKDEFEQQFGRIHDVHGEQHQTESGRATADTRIKTDRGETSLTFTLTREHHEWKIDQFPELSE